ncbi:homocysteine S-methyltransferase family protein [Floccifex sp.]|uniref:homocysteine S-methyltransferase family protein n=1 Tax=Floccifex sp. TaxID=2815810 RepID=UPI003EFE40E6
MKNEYILLDGAMGTMLQKYGLGLGQRPEVFGLEHPDILENIHRQYINSGSQVIYANTFGLNRHKVSNLNYSLEELLIANIQIAKKAAGNQCKVALDIGPIGELMEPYGTLSFEEAYDIFAQIIDIAKTQEIDIVVFETMSDLYEVKAGVLAAKEHCDLPIWVTMSFEKNGRTFTGTKVASMACVLDSLKIDAMGINCSLGPDEIYPLIKEMKQWTDIDLIVKPNAGLPNPATGEYQMDASTFKEKINAFKELGVSMIGGCCGSTPSFIQACNKDKEIQKISMKSKHGICSSSQMIELNQVRVVGERINPTGKKRFQQALKEHDLNYIMEQAIAQVDSGADVLDVNVGLPGIDEISMMIDVIKAIQSVVTVPLQIDSSNIQAIEAGLRVCNGKAIVNSVNGDNCDSILPIVKKYGASVIGLTLDKNGIPQDAISRFNIAQRIYQKAKSYDIDDKDIIIDCLTLTISAQQNQAMETLKAMQIIKEKLGLYCTLGVSNISFGLPSRNHIICSFLTSALYCGLDLPIVNPNSQAIMDCIHSFKAISCQDKDCQDYIQRFANIKEEKVISSSGMDIESAVIKGLKEECYKCTLRELETMNEMDIINLKLIPALDKVGELYEQNKLFLPQLINAANAACAGFDCIKERIANKGQNISKGKILLATVEGDIHDIGKNIVKVVLENYGYQVIDLGKDVPVAKVVEQAIYHNVYLIGLSALMTTTVESMKKTIQALKDSKHPCVIMVGGAVLTEEYAKEIGADYYSKDAKQSADIAKKVLG